MSSAKSYKWYLENGCEIVPLKRACNRDYDYSLTVLDIQADFSEFLVEENNIISNDKIVKADESIFNIQKKQFLHKDMNILEREKYVYEIDHLWAYIEWHYNFEDEIRLQRNLVSNINKLKKVPKLYVSAHIIEGVINEMSKNENICILKYTTFSSFYEKYKNELDNIKMKNKNSIYNVCNYIYEVCDIADKSLLFATSPVINTTMKNVLSITKSGKKREDFNEEAEKEIITEDEIWQIYISKRIKCINDQWLLICINQELKKIIKESGDLYFKMFNRYIKEYNDFLKSHEYNTTDKNNDMNNMDIKNNNVSKNDNNNNININRKSNIFLKGTQKNIFEVNHINHYLNNEKLKKYKVNLIFSENKDINIILYKLCVNLGKFNDAVLCTKNKTYNILMNDIDGTLAICLQSFISKYYRNNSMDNSDNMASNSTASCSVSDNYNAINTTNFSDDINELIKNLSIMGLCKEKIVLTEKATIFNNIELLYSYYLIVQNEALDNDDEENKSNILNNLEKNEKNYNNNDDGIIYFSKKALFENLQFSNEEISSYLLHLQKYSTNNLIYIKNKGFRYIKSEIIYEFIIKLIELISINDEMYEYQYVQKSLMKNSPFSKYQEDLYKNVKKKYGISFTNLMHIIYENIHEFEFLNKNKIPIEKYVILQLCWKCCDIENNHFEYFNIYYNYYFFYEYLNKSSNELSFENIFEEYLQFLNNDIYIDETIIYFNLFKLHNIMSLNILRSSGQVVIHSDKLFTFDMDIFTHIKYIDDNFKNFNSSLMDKIIQTFIKSYQFFLDFGYDKSGTNEKNNQHNNINMNNSIYNNNNNNINSNGDASLIDNEIINTDIYKDRVLFRNNILLNVNNINHICNDNYMFEYFIVVKYYYSDNSFALLEKKLKKFIKTAEEEFMHTYENSTDKYNMHTNFKSNWDNIKSNYCLNYKIFKYQTTSFPHIRLNNNYNDLLNLVYTPLSLHCSIFRENVIYNKKRNTFQLIPSFLLKNNLRSCLTALFTFKNSYYAQEFYPFLNPLLNNKDLIGTIAVPPLRHCRTKLVEKENENNVEFIETKNIVLSTLNNDIKNYKMGRENNNKIVEKLCKLYNCNLPVNNFST
ncbi:hypothetical protein PGSY75_0824200 [Plasmodium gaboni]|uniref:Uncharacterized protein n=1 Tax=Plasmodium gaboni TaxID=647221 RepID=A0A151LNM1_9APIC|nr:hypothetical protein PGSY75_0824200 [Plasmodium gaboni]KYO00833.1 hypothetical protein PGSY75_0824200 [Plasmodium gaboni]